MRRRERATTQIRAAIARGDALVSCPELVELPAEALGDQEALVSAYLATMQPQRFSAVPRTMVVGADRVSAGWQTWLRGRERLVNAMRELLAQNPRSTAAPREWLRLSRAELATLAGVSKSTIDRWLTPGPDLHSAMVAYWDARAATAYVHPETGRLCYRKVSFEAVANACLRLFLTEIAPVRYTHVQSGQVRKGKNRYRVLLVDPIPLEQLEAFATRLTELTTPAPAEVTAEEAPQIVIMPQNRVQPPPHHCPEIGQPESRVVVPDGDGNEDSRITPPSCSHLSIGNGAARPGWAYEEGGPAVEVVEARAGWLRAHEARILACRIEIQPFLDHYSEKFGDQCAASSLTYAARLLVGASYDERPARMVEVLDQARAEAQRIAQVRHTQPAGARGALPTVNRMPVFLHLLGRLCGGSRNPAFVPSRQKEPTTHVR